MPGSSSTRRRKEALVEHNRICDADRGIEAGGTQTLLWGNRFERVKEPLAGVADSVFMQPADRLLGELSAVGVGAETQPTSGDSRVGVRQLPSRRGGSRRTGEPESVGTGAGR